MSVKTKLQLVDLAGSECVGKDEETWNVKKVKRKFYIFAFNMREKTIIFAEKISLIFYGVLFGWYKNK